MIVQLTQNRQYQAVMILRPTLSFDKANEMVQNILHKHIKNMGLECIKNQNSTMQMLSYPMDRNKQGHFITMELNLPPSVLQSLRREMEIDENFLRVLFCKIDKKKVTKEKERYGFQLGDEFIKNISSHTTKRGKIHFARNNLSRKSRCKIAKSIKKLRFIGRLPYCNYDM